MENEGDASSRLVSLSLSRFHLPHLHHNGRAAMLLAPGPLTQTFVLWLLSRMNFKATRRMTASCIRQIA